MVASPRHGRNSTLRLHSSTILGACLLQSYGAIYSQSQPCATDEVMTLYHVIESGQFVIFGWQENLRALLTHDPAVYRGISLTLCQRALLLVTFMDDDDDDDQMHALGSAS
jgi:hypothetical protein